TSAPNRPQPRKGPNRPLFSTSTPLRQRGHTLPLRPHTSQTVVRSGRRLTAPLRHSGQASSFYEQSAYVEQEKQPPFVPFLSTSHPAQHEGHLSGRCFPFPSTIFS